MERKRLLVWPYRLLQLWCRRLSTVTLPPPPSGEGKATVLSLDLLRTEISAPHIDFRILLTPPHSRYLPPSAALAPASCRRVAAHQPTKEGRHPTRSQSKLVLLEHDFAADRSRWYYLYLLPDRLARDCSLTHHAGNTDGLSAVKSAPTDIYIPRNRSAGDLLSAAAANNDTHRGRSSVDAVAASAPTSDFGPLR